METKKEKAENRAEQKVGQAQKLLSLKHRLSAPVPLHFLLNWQGAEIWVQRDDLLPFSFGGNKVRFVLETLQEMADRGCDVLVSYGSPASNLNRAAAHMAAAAGFGCTVVYKFETVPGERAETARFNERMVRESGAALVSCTRETVGRTIAEVLQKLTEEGHRPYYIYGDETGHGGEKVLLRAYRRVYEQLSDCTHIFLPCGTGMTQSGLLLGQLDALARRKSGASETEKEEKKENTSLPPRTVETPADSMPFIHGISVARTETQCRLAVCEALQCDLGRELSEAEAARIKVTDSYLCGGYGQADTELQKLCEALMRQHGLPLDLTYTGKAFYGMLCEIERKKLSGRVIFLHTGGVPGFFDRMQSSTQASE